MVAKLLQYKAITLKKLKGIVIAILIFGLPLGSYMYLRSGFMYRKDTLELLKNKTELRIDQLQAFGEKKEEVVSRFQDGVTVFQYIKSQQDKDDLYFLAENLRSRKDFQLVALADSANYPLINDTIYNSTISRLQLDSETVVSFFGESRFLLAKDSFVRKDYSFSQEDMLAVYEHAVVLLPMKKRDKVKLVRKTDDIR